MKVLVVAPEYPPHAIGGGGAVYARVASHLASQGHTVSVVFGDFGNLSPLADVRQASDVAPGVTRIEVPLLPNPKRLGWMLSAMPPTPRAARTLARLLAERRWDVAHLHGVGFPLVDLCGLMLRKIGLPYVLTVHGVPRTPFERGWLPSIAARAYLNAMTRRTIHGATEVTAVSGAVLNDANFPIRRGRIIPNGIDPPDKTAHRSRHAQTEGEPLRLFSAGRLSRNKGIDIAIRAVAMLRRQRSLRYDIYGPDGGDGTALRALAAALGAGDSIQFLGAFASEERDEIFASHDALLMPSRVEGFGLAALEALRMGLVVVANPVDGLADFLTDDNAVLVRSEDPLDWKAALAAWDESDAASRRTRSVAARATARVFCWERALLLYEQELSRVASLWRQNARAGLFDGDAKPMEERITG